MVQKKENLLFLLARRTKELRTSAGLSQDAFAKLIGRHRTLISGVEVGEKNLALDTLDLIAAGLGVEAVSLFEDNVIPRDTENLLSLRERVVANVRILRAARGFSQDELSELAELSRNYVTRLESQKPNADLKHLEKLADALGIPIGRLIGPPACDHKVSKR